MIDDDDVRTARIALRAPLRGDASAARDARDVRTVRTVRIARGFDLLAPVYDLLAFIVFGRTLRRAQTGLLDELRSARTVLVVGGGTGFLLEAILARTEARVLHLDLSAGMVRRARRRLERRRPQDLGRVLFVRGDLRGLPLAGSFDAICTPFVLDLLDASAVLRAVRDLRAVLAPQGVWYDTDFRRAVRGPLRPAADALLAVMYSFFRLTCGIDARRLPAIDASFAAAGLVVRREQSHLGGLVRALILAHPHRSGAGSGLPRPSKVP